MLCFQPVGKAEESRPGGGFLGHGLQLAEDVDHGLHHHPVQFARVRGQQFQQETHLKQWQNLRNYLKGNGKVELLTISIILIILDNVCSI